MKNQSTPEYIIKAAYTDDTIRVYQAYCPEIAKPALKAGRFVPPFGMGRMTWIKPSFNWMMYRSGFASKPGQEFVLGIDITREGFEWAIKNASLSSFTSAVHTSHAEWRRLVKEKPVRIQWDPARDYRLNEIKDVRAIQIGLSREAVRRYVNEWVVNIEDMTDIAHQIGSDVKNRRIPKYLPDQLETSYPFDISQLDIIPKPPEKKTKLNEEGKIKIFTSRAGVKGNAPKVGGGEGM